jgi:hypothetical protein
MATMIAEVYDALIEAGASQEKARKAAEAVASYDTRFNRLENEFTAVKGDLSLLKWMSGFSLALTVAVLFKLFS